jgi:pimeloyl-ACP methyl ester carboxylesterase
VPRSVLPRVETRWIGPPPTEAPTIVFLHEGLGCVATWRDFPDRVAAATGCGALVYSRVGYGASEAVRGPRSIRFMHDEALQVLPALVEHFALRDVILYGHSDGASIAIIYAGRAGVPPAGRAPSRRRGGETPPVQPARTPARLILEAPHVFVEPICIESIRRVSGNARLRERLARYHGENTESMFRTWCDVWLTPEFARWNIEESLPRITSPVLVIQGEKDEYGTVKQVEAIVAQVRGPVTTLLLPDCGHSPHSERPDEVLRAVALFSAQAMPAL